MVSTEETIAFIKMDIEGSEIPAIIGAENSIKRCRPNLAICIYHNETDLWEIPILIHDICPTYKMYIRHHGNFYCDTELYATI